MRAEDGAPDQPQQESAHELRAHSACWAPSRARRRQRYKCPAFGSLKKCTLDAFRELALVQRGMQASGFRPMPTPGRRVRGEREAA